MTSLRFSLISLSLLLNSQLSFAADINAGKASAAACQGCHGVNGVSTSPSWPILAGQSAAYLETQLKAFKSGARSNPSMNPIAQELGAAEIQNLAAYFASLPNQAAGGGEKQLINKGKTAASMCMGCHGDQLQGKGQFPRLGGQHAAYLENQLKNFKSGSRSGGPMNGIVQSLSDEDFKAIAAFAANLGK